MSNNCKVKGILRGIRFISQIFESDKEQEIEIGHPTDVKHVAHIGWQGPSAENNPSWMNEFKSVHGLSASAPLSLHGDIHSQGDEYSDDSIKRGSRRQSMGNMRESHAKEKSDRPKNPKTRSSKSKESSSCNNNESTQPSNDMDSIQQQIQGCSSDLNLQPPRNNLLPDVPKLKVKDASSNAGSTSTKSRSSSRAQRNLNKEISSRSGHKARKKHRHFEEDQSESEQDQDQDGSDKILWTN
ncbi:CRIB domain-containing protein RIC10-like [Arachis duranensis]|uniref:CRIB domain-containing protein RIC10-like n=1 Tax=Arachis duranensis TaxID=130453 RepID=A0A6P5MG54_ARADU|nr:CRIB domain-containing protein RIC10-like [Arachis duranensis]XP_057722950.1 CRIB domain-containing protein RIC10-like [Arachis stenosperma]